MLRVVVSGATGRMGAALARLAQEDRTIDVVGGIGRYTQESGYTSVQGYPLIQSPEDAAGLVGEADVVVDFSSPELLARLIAAQRRRLAGVALVVGTTGLGEAEHALLDELAAQSPVLPAPNFSVGVNLLVALAGEAARALGDGFDIEIVEAHHRRKADAPSGTALQLGRAIAEARGVDLEAVRRDGRSAGAGAGAGAERPIGEIGFHAVRGGDVVGEHQVLFLGARERVVLGHAAVDRALFAEGALRAARWLHGRAAGRYSMRQVLGLEPC